MSTCTAAETAPDRGFVTLTVAGQLCGVPVLGVREVITDSKIARVPLSPPEIAGNINLRGRIVTAIDTRRRLGLGMAEAGSDATALVVEADGILYALLIDQVQEVLTLRNEAIEEVPHTLPAAWRQFGNGICRLPDRLMVVLDINRLLAFAA